MDASAAVGVVALGTRRRYRVEEDDVEGARNSQQLLERARAARRCADGRLLEEPPDDGSEHEQVELAVVDDEDAQVRPQTARARHGRGRGP